MKIFTSGQIKTIKDLAIKQGLSEDIIIKNAVNAVKSIINKKTDLNNKNCVIICGTRNSSKIGYILAKNLYNSYINIKIISIDDFDIKIKNRGFFDLKSEIEKIGIKIYNTNNITIKQISDLINSADVLIDNIGVDDFKLETKDEIKALSVLWNQSKAIKFAIDVPTGINIDKATVSKFCFKTDYTISFIGLKPAHVMAGSKEICGKVIVTDIGINRNIIEKIEASYFLIDEEMIWQSINIRKVDTHKGNYGKLLNLSGSRNMRGAAALSTLGALRVGAGIVTLASINTVITSVITNILEAKTLKLNENTYGTVSISSLDFIISEINKSDVCLIGCGLGVNSETVKLVKYIVKEATCPIVIDADAINIIAENLSILKSKKSKIILTPHLGEMSRLTKLSISEIINSKLEVITEFVKEYNVTVVLKDYNTIIIDENSKVYFNVYGNPGLAKGGSGDVLSGMVAGFLVQKIDLAAVCGVYLHSKAAERCSKRKSKYAMLPSDILEDVCDIFLEAGR